MRKGATLRPFFVTANALAHSSQALQLGLDLSGTGLRGSQLGLRNRRQSPLARTSRTREGPEFFEFARLGFAAAYNFSSRFIDIIVQTVCVKVDRDKILPRFLPGFRNLTSTH